MRLSLDDLDETGLTRTFSEPVERFDALLELQSQQIRFLSPIEGEVSLERRNNDLQIHGRFRTRLAMACSRCLAEFEQPVESAFELLAVVDATASEASLDPEVELDRSALDEVQLTDQEIDLQAMLQEQVLLALPVQPLCDTGCRGLCPSCGCDLNTESCDCDQRPVDGPFSVLKDFKVKD